MQAANRWIAPYDLNPLEVCEKIMNAAIGKYVPRVTYNSRWLAIIFYPLAEGDANELISVLDAAGINSLQMSALRPKNGKLLPLHRAVSGFHFHGNQRLLLKTLAVLIERGADMAAVDHYGNTVLHKAIQVC